MTDPSRPEEYAAGPPFPAWPQDGQVELADQLVQRSLARLDALPRTDLAGHEAVYTEIHDELRAALDADPLAAQSDQGRGGA